jgi:TnpA family transposase
VLAAREAARLLEREAVTALKAAVDPELRGDEYYAILEAKSLKVQRRVAPILRALQFAGERGTEPLLAALAHFRASDGVLTKAAPDEFLEPPERAAVHADGRFHVSLYKAFLFLHVQGALRSGSLNLTHSYKYRPLGAYLIERERWQRDKAQLLARAELAPVADPHAVLEALDEALHRQYAVTNAHLADGSNPHVTFRAAGDYSVHTPPQADTDAERLAPFFHERRIVPLGEVLATVNRHTGFLDELQHWQQRYHHGRPATAAVYAALIGLGCTIGVRKMARISRPLTEAELEHIVHWYFSVDALHAANDRVLQLLDRLDLPNAARGTPDRLHTVSDGQKFEVRVDSLNANYSYKYFGKGQGVSVYTFRDERDLLWYSTVFSSAERECAYVIDGLMHNDVVKSDIHSTDASGFSELVFGVSHLLGFSYAPRFRNLPRQRLYTFPSRRGTDRAAWKIRPTGYVDTDLILQQWDEILRVIATIKLKEVTASDLFRRLNSYSKQHTLYQALKAFGQILKSLFILRYLDDPALRQAIEKQLDRIEHVHRFTRAVSVGNPREFLQAEKHEQELAEACKRLVKNSIICWNYLYLAQQLADTEDATGRAAFVDAVAHGSAVAWQHINLLGEYDFSEEKLQDSVGIRPPVLTR